MKRSELKIGLALSGGGIRAAIYHLGVLKYLAENNLLEQVTHISSVSGASMCVGLLYAKNNMRFPTSSEYLTTILPTLKEQILNVNLEQKAIIEAIFKFKFNKKANAIALALAKHWGINGGFGDISKKPLWSVVCTSYETGKHFRFSQDIVGDWAFGYIKDSNFPLADAIAASAAFPFLIGTYEIDTKPFEWCDKSGTKIEPKSDKLHLWDGGVYDNFGLEPIYQMENNGMYSDDVNFCILSNAGKSISFQSKKTVTRIVDVTTDQISILRARAFRDFIFRNKNGYYLKMGRDFSEVVRRAKQDMSLADKYKNDFLSEEDCQKVANYSTTLKNPTEQDFDLILRQGYESIIYNKLVFDFIEP